MNHLENIEKHVLKSTVLALVAPKHQNAAVVTHIAARAVWVLLAVAGVRSGPAASPPQITSMQHASPV